MQLHIQISKNSHPVRFFFLQTLVKVRTITVTVLCGNIRNLSFVIVACAEESTEIQATELPDKPSSKSNDCTNENYDSEVEGSLVDEAEATPVSTGEEEHLADSSRLEISVSFETKDVMCEKGSSEHEEEPDTVSALKETVEEGLVSANFKESLDSEVMAQFTQEKEIVDILEGKFDRDDAKDVAGDNGSPQKFDFAGSEGVFLPKVALAPSPDEDFKDPTEFTELQVFAETSSSLQHELGADNSSSILTALEHLGKGFTGFYRFGPFGSKTHLDFISACCIVVFCLNIAICWISSRKFWDFLIAAIFYSIICLIFCATTMCLSFGYSFKSQSKA